MDSDRAGGAFDSVADHVIAVRADAARIGVHVNKVLILRRGEWMVGRIPSILVFVPFDEREVEYPTILQRSRIAETTSISNQKAKARQNAIDRRVTIRNEAKKVTSFSAADLENFFQLGRFEELRDRALNAQSLRRNESF